NLIDMDLAEYSRLTSSLHYHDHYEILIYLGNQCQFIVNDTSYTLYNGDIMIIPPNVPHLMSSEEGINNTRYICMRSEEHTSELQSRFDLVCRLLLEKKNDIIYT